MNVSQRSWNSCYRSNLLGVHCVASEHKEGGHEGRELVKYRSIAIPEVHIDMMYWGFT